MHGFYGIGATISPVIATSMATKYHLGWYAFFYVVAGTATLELVAATISFWHSTGEIFRQSQAGTHSESGRMKASLKNRVTWLCAMFLLAYVGGEGMSSLVSPFESQLTFLFSLFGRLHRCFHDPCPRRRALRIWNDCNRLLARHHSRPVHLGLHHSSSWRKAGRRHLLGPRYGS